MSVSKDDVTVVLPTLNEEEAIGKVIEELKQVGYHNILVVDGYSTDRTAVKTYSPYLKSYETDADSQFTLNYDMTYTSPPQLIGVSNNVANGGTATAQWNGLKRLTTYE